MSFSKSINSLSLKIKKASTYEKVKTYWITGLWIRQKIQSVWFVSVARSTAYYSGSMTTFFSILIYFYMPQGIGLQMPYKSSPVNIITVYVPQSVHKTNLELYWRMISCPIQ